MSPVDKAVIDSFCLCSLGQFGEASRSKMEAKRTSRPSQQA